MSLKRMEYKKKAKDNLMNVWYALMKPLANLVDKINSRKYENKVKACKNISDEDLMRKYAKYVTENLVNRSYRGPEEFIVFNKTSYAMSNDEFESRILYKIRNVRSNDKILNDWHLHNSKSKLYYEKDSKEMIEYERKLNKLLKDELNNLGVYAEYEVHTGEHLSKRYADIKQMWLDRIGYEKTLVVRVDK